MNRLFTSALRAHGTTPFTTSTPINLPQSFSKFLTKRTFSTRPYNQPQATTPFFHTITPNTTTTTSKYLTTFHTLRRQVHTFTPNTKAPRVKATPEQQLQDFLGRTDHRPLSRVDQAAKAAFQQQSEQSKKLVAASGSGKFYLLSRLIFAFETWTIIFFTGAFGYYIYNVLEYREDSPWDIAVRMWENFLENSRQYRSMATGKTSIEQYRADILRDKLTLNPDDQEAKDELKALEVKEAKRARHQQIRAKEEAQAAAEWAKFSTDLLEQATKADGAQLSDEDLLALIRQNNQAQLLNVQLNGLGAENKDVFGEQAAQQSKRRHFQ